MNYHIPASADNTALPLFFGLPLLDWREPASNDSTKSPYPTGLTAAGRVVWRKCRRDVAVCNAIASLAGIGLEVHHVS
jgi:hypothetical protein